MIAIEEDSPTHSTFEATVKCNSIQDLSEQMDNIKLQSPTRALDYKPSWPSATFFSDSDQKRNSTDQLSVPEFGSPATDLNTKRNTIAEFERSIFTRYTSDPKRPFPRAIPLWLKRVVDSDTFPEDKFQRVASEDGFPILTMKDRKTKRRAYSAPYPKSKEVREAQKAALHQVQSIGRPKAGVLNAPYELDRGRGSRWKQDVDELERTMDITPKSPHWKDSPRELDSITNNLSAMDL